MTIIRKYILNESINCDAGVARTLCAIKIRLVDGGAFFYYNYIKNRDISYILEMERRTSPRCVTSCIPSDRVPSSDARDKERLEATLLDLL